MGTIEMDAHEASSVLARRLYRSRQSIEIMTRGRPRLLIQGVEASA
jgi:hypothetical protein